MLVTPQPVQLTLNEIDGRELLRLMYLAREGDRREGILVRQGLGWIQVPGAGNEAMAALHLCLEPQDYIYPSYRERALLLARGLSNYEIALAFFGRADSWSAGRLMSSHYSSSTLRIVASASPTGLQCLPAAGTSWASRLKGDTAVVLCCIGEAALRQGEFYEAWCFALQQNLPVVFLVEDNGYGISTPTSGMTPWNIGALAPERLFKVDGRDVEAVLEMGQTVVTNARGGNGPAVLWMEIDRLLSHTSSDDHRVYRSKEELALMHTRDPLTLLRDKLMSTDKLTLEEWEQEKSTITDRVAQDYLRAQKAEAPQDALTHIFSARKMAPVSAALPSQEDWTMVDALNHTLNEALQSDPRVVLFGEDIEDPKGGVFGLTKGLSARFPGRVTNSPLAEATIAGVAAGLAVAGYRPVFELQFIDFCGPAFNQIVNQLATLRWRSNGEWSCPSVFLAPCGAYLPAGGPWHSQSNEAWFAHAPGLNVVMPSNAQDAAALVRLAIAGDDPVIVLLPKHLFRKRTASYHEDPFNLGEARIERAGNDVTIVAWGNCVEIAAAAAVELETEGISAEIVDLRSIVPCDWAAIRRSLAKTGYLVVVQEDNRTCSFGQAIIAEMTSLRESWDYFAAPPALVSRPDVHIGFHPDLENAVLPSVEQVCSAVYTIMELA